MATQLLLINESTTYNAVALFLVEVLVNVHQEAAAGPEQLSSLQRCVNVNRFAPTGS